MTSRFKNVLLHVMSDNKWKYRLLAGDDSEWNSMYELCVAKSNQCEMIFSVRHDPGYATPILHSGGIRLKTTSRTAFIKIISKFYNNYKTKNLSEDQIK